MSSSVVEGILDSEDMFGFAANLPDHLESSFARSRAIDFDVPVAIDAVGLVGMGGSSVAGEVIAALGAPSIAVPILSVNSYDLPGAINARSLVVVSSFSGNTEETISATNEAIARGAQVVVITSGGQLAEIASQNGLVCFVLPNNIPEPRAALGAALGPLLALFERAGLLPDASSQLDAALSQLRARRVELVAKDGGIAAQIARRVGRSFPFMYAGAGIGAVAARRWKTQVNENAKQPAFFAVHPEACHNEIVGYGQSGDVTRQVFTMIELRNDHEHPRVALRFSLVEDALREVMADVIEVRAKGESALAQLLDLVMIGDFMSLHLATQEGVDPGPVPLLGEIKAALAAQ